MSNFNIRTDFKAREKVGSKHAFELEVQHKRGFGKTGVYVSVSIERIEDGCTVYTANEGHHESNFLADMPRYNAGKIREHSLDVNEQLKTMSGPVWDMFEKMKVVAMAANVEHLKKENQ